MKLKKFKPYYRVKGKYRDNRNRIVIEFLEGNKVKSLAIPKPEDLLKLLRKLREENGRAINPEFCEENVEKNGQIYPKHLRDAKFTKETGE